VLSRRQPVGWRRLFFFAEAFVAKAVLLQSLC